jgi:hypothetical protein
MQRICSRTVVLSLPKSYLSRIGRAWKPRVDPPHRLNGIINRIPERVFPCGRWPAIQPRQSPNQKHSGHEINQFLSAFVHREDKISSSFYLRLRFFLFSAEEIFLRLVFRFIDLADFAT